MLARRFVSPVLCLAALSTTALLITPARAQNMGGAATTQPAAGAADVTGTWTWEVQGFNGPTDMTLVIQRENGQLTGTISGFGGEDWDLEDVKADGNKVTFKTTREFGDQTMVTTYTGTVEGDTFNGRSETVFARDFTAKREK